MQKKFFILFTLLLVNFLAKADGYVTYLYHVNVGLTDGSAVSGYFIDVDFPDKNKFENEDELKAFLIQKTRSETGKLQRLYKNLFKVLEYPSVGDWIRGQIIIEKGEQIEISETDIVKVQLTSVNLIPSQNIVNVTDEEIKYLIKEPTAIETLKLEDVITEVGDAYVTYALFSYNPLNTLELNEIAVKIEDEYFTTASNSNSMEKFGIWKNIFKKYKDQLKTLDVLLLEISGF
jgi:hypothetical protein